VPSDAAAILLLEAGQSRLRLVSAAGLADLPERDLLIPVGEGIAGRAAATGALEAVAPIKADGPLEAVLGTAGMGSALVVPMKVEGRVSGAILVARHAASPFAEGDHRLLALIADRAALAIEHARLYQRELGIVEALQRSLLPERLPRLPGVDIAARYIAGGAGADVGGDWYDAIPLAGGRIAMALGDVVGHGIGAAALMGQLRNALRAYALEGHSPSEVVSKLDRMVQRLEQGRMATLLFMVFEPDLGTVRFSSAGHLPPLVVDPDGVARYLDDGRTPPLGVMPEAEHVEATAEIPAGSTLVLYSDGLVEERGVGLDRGLETLKRTTVKGSREPEALCDQIIESLFEDRDVRDDVAVLVLRTVALHEARLELELTADPDAQRAMRRTLGRWLTGAGVGDEVNHEVQVACHEVCSNSIEHGHRFSDEIVVIEAELEGDLLSVVVTDSGTWRDPRESDRGRGLDMAQAFMDTVEVEISSDGTRVSMTRRLDLSSDGGDPARKAKPKPKASRRKRAAPRTAPSR
jgi:serine phosphatase RsbU (regulator of sigma subunit)/anti-sigma regulatory factor (Ser/Thr protein kinase)